MGKISILSTPKKYSLGWFVDKYRRYRVKYPVKKKSSNIFGLTYIPTLQPYYSDDDDFIFGLHENVPIEVSDGNLSKVKEAFLSKKEGCKFILEIGVCRNELRSMTHVFLKNKKNETIFLGIDIDDKTFLNDPDKNIYTLRTDSVNQKLVRSKIKEIGNYKIDLLFIDGWHSINAVVNDWKYTDLLSDHGVVIMHDTNCHPGPMCVFDAVDENLFNKQKYFSEDADWGLAILEKK